MAHVLVVVVPHQQAGTVEIASNASPAALARLPNEFLVIG
jgi:hypothetical protein